MSTLKTQPNDADVGAYLNRVSDKKKRADCFTILEIMKEVTGSEPQMGKPTLHQVMSADLSLPLHHEN